MLCYCLLYFCYAVRDLIDNVCDIILYDIAVFCYMVSYMMLFLVEFCCRCCWSVILLSNVPGKKATKGDIIEVKWTYRGMK